MRLRAPLAALLLATTLVAPSASAEPPVTKIQGPPPAEPVPLEDPDYKPAAHGGLPYGTFLLMTRGVRRRSTGMMATGIVLTSLGAVTMATGTGIYFGKGGCSDAPQLSPTDISGDFGPTPCSRGKGQTAGMAILLAGLITTVLGVPLWVLGASDVPWVEAAGLNDRAPSRPFMKGETPKPPAGPAWAGFVPALTPARNGVGLGWRF